MTKLTNPLFSFRAVGRLAKDLALRRSRGVNILESKPIPTDIKSPAQLEWRHMYQKAVALWHALSAAEKQEWESLARPKHMTGYAWFMSQCLRPNPGIYLPLQGGTMSGDIDMAKHRILALPFPTDNQEPVRLEDYNIYILPYLYKEGAKVYHSAQQAIPHDALTSLAFDSENWDTDDIHDPITNNSRLTCRTAGTYLVTAWATFFFNAVGSRQMLIYKNGTPYMAHNVAPGGAGATGLELTMVFDLLVGQYVRVAVWQNSGAPLPIDGGGTWNQPLFAMHRIM